MHLSTVSTFILVSSFLVEINVQAEAVAVNPEELVRVLNSVDGIRPIRVVGGKVDMKGVESVVITEYLCDELLNLTLLGNVLKVGLSEGPGPDGSAAKVLSSLALTAYKGLEIEEK